MLDALDPALPVLIAGPTASGKSDLALQIASTQGGVIVNADASQVYDCWRILTARPSTSEEEIAEHRLYGHVSAHTLYSAGHWLRDIAQLMDTGARLIVVGGTGLYFSALTRGLADIPPITPDIREAGEAISHDARLASLDAQTKDRIDTKNPARVQRAWEVLQATGRGLAQWQDETDDPLLPIQHVEAIVFDTPKDWLNDRIETRFDKMLAAGALDEVRQVMPDYDPSLPAHRAIGAPELVAHLRGEMTLQQARDAAVISTRQLAKRQRTWFRSKMQEWRLYEPLL